MYVSNLVVKKLSEVSARNRALEYGFKITDTTPYPGAGIPWKAECPVGHETYIRIDAVHKYGCNVCANIEVGKRRVIAPDVAVSIMEDRGFTPLEPYVGSKNRWKSLCSVGHVSYPSLQNVRRGHGCFYCKSLSASVRNRLIGSQVVGYLYLVKFVDLDETVFLKVGIGLSGGTWDRLAEHRRFGGTLIEIVYDVRDRCYLAEQEIIKKYSDAYRYSPSGKGSWGSGTECFVEKCPINLTDWI